MRVLEAQKEKQLEERAKFIEKTKNLLVFTNQPDDDRPSKKGKVKYSYNYFLIHNVVK